MTSIFPLRPVLWYSRASRLFAMLRVLSVFLVRVKNIRATL
jgi:hypothetical protein